MSNLEVFDSAIKKLNTDERCDFAMYLLGAASVCIDEDKWLQMIKRALRWAKEKSKNAYHTV